MKESISHLPVFSMNSIYTIIIILILSITGSMEGHFFPDLSAYHRNYKRNYPSLVGPSLCYMLWDLWMHKWDVQEWEKFVSNICAIRHIKVAIPLPYGNYIWTIQILIPFLALRDTKLFISYSGPMVPIDWIWFYFIYYTFKNRYE